jgi:hypothetical protein
MGSSPVQTPKRRQRHNHLPVITAKLTVIPDLLRPCIALAREFVDLDRARLTELLVARSDYETMIIREIDLTIHAHSQSDMKTICTATTGMDLTMNDEPSDREHTREVGAGVGAGLRINILGAERTTEMLR